MKKKHKGLLIGVAALVLLGGGIGFYEYEKHKHLKIGPGQSGNLTLHPGNQSVDFSGNGDTLTISLPQGASWTSVRFGGVTIPATGGSPVSIPMAASGSGTITWTDSSGTAQTTNLTVTKTA